MKTCLIVNPKAGSITDLDALLKKLRRIPAAEVRMTRRAGDAEKFARAAVRAGTNFVIAAGGDGTLNAVINGMARPRRSRNIRVGLVPLGTGNDFARSLGLPASIDDNIEILRAGRTTAIDLVRANGKRVRYFINISAGGFSGFVDKQLTPEIKRAWGPLAYLRGAAAAWRKLRSFVTTLILDDDEQLGLELYNVVVANGRFVAGGLPIAPKAKPNDGLLDVILIPNRPAAQLAILAAQMFLGQHLDNDAIVFRRAAKVAVRSRPRMQFNVDGELVGSSPIVFQVVPRALDFVTNK